ncbi:MAG TPA: sulfite exporter TauE/SafE family protein [Candidatus Intestinimonas pullistercoris]|uniref:Probable membrane transporter protein n=2 Tax=Intestinimonas TaxID=1392389 RepID=A0A9D2T013_9FIRM|nr:sulfite exporter TauE/SafE family protein [uncultured Intestinimonas sp.]HJC40411.1 sulfite exporter TauE/SafE family protein [Candidatus Intestinimonas pullistercoris]
MVFLLLVSFFASVGGAICGIGGGVIIKPALDALNIASVSTISFLSGCTVLSMSCYSVGKALAAKESLVDFKTGTPLALGGAVGGIVGKSLFSALTAMFSQQSVGICQSLCLAALTLMTICYTLNQRRIHTHHITNPVVCVLVGLVLGILSSFLGIGGGPINLVVLYYFFSMSTKVAAQNSLYIILISQITSLGTTLLTGAVPPFQWSWLILMVVGGISGGMVGRKINKRIDDRQVERLFIGLMVIITLISLYNAWRFWAA